MNANYRMVLAMFLISFAGVSAAAGGERPVAVNTDGLPGFVAAKVKAKAAEGASELRRYVWITRSQHNLSMRTLVAASDGR
jgi:hypothetical protein